MAWKPGETGNANGAKRPRIIAQQITSALNEAFDESRTKLRKVVDALIDKAMDGDVASINAIMDRVDGKVPQAVEGTLEHEFGDPLLALLQTIAQTGRSIVSDDQS